MTGLRRSTASCRLLLQQLRKKISNKERHSLLGQVTIGTDRLSTPHSLYVNCGVAHFAAHYSYVEEIRPLDGVHCL